MFGKRILNVEVYGDQTIYGIKHFKDSIVVPENSLYCYQIADIGTFITDNNFVTLTTLDTTLALYATISSPTFSGTVTFIDTSVQPNTTSTIKDYLKITTAASTYLTQSNASSTYLSQSSAASTYLTPSSASTTYLSQTNAASTYLTITNASNTYLSQTNAASTYLTISNASTSYATKVTPTFSGTVTFTDISVTPNTTSTIQDYLKITTAASTYLTQSNASTTYLSQTNAASTYLTITNAASAYLSQNSASTTYLTITNASTTYLSQSNATSTYLTITNASNTYALKASPTFTGTVTMPNGTTIDQYSAAYLTSIPNNYLTTSTVISQSKVSDSSGWISTAIAANAAAIAAIAAGSLFVDAAGAAIYATNVSLGITNGSITTLRNYVDATFYTQAQTDFRYLGPLDQNYTLGSLNGTTYTTTIYQNLTIGNYYTYPTSTFWGKMLFHNVINGDETLTIGKMNMVNEDEDSGLYMYKYTKFYNKAVFMEEVNAATTLVIGKFNSVGETSANSLNIYKVTNFWAAVEFHSTVSISGGFQGNLYPTNSGGSITGINGNAMIYSADAAAGGVHLIKANNVDLMRLESTGITTYKKIVAAGIQSNSSNSSSFYVGGGNVFDLTAISTPKVINGISNGTGDEATYDVFNNAINSWWGTGFVNTCNHDCNVVINHRSGNIKTKGTVIAENGVNTNVCMGTNGLEYNTTTDTGIHNFKIYGTQKVYINNSDLTNTVNLTQVGDATFNNKITVNGQSTFNNTINALSGISLGGTNTDPVTITKNIIGDNVSELALSPGDDGSVYNLITLPLSGDTVQDYVTIRSIEGIHHAFSTSGNYYCSGNIVVTGTVTANAFIGTSSNAIGSIVNASSFQSLPTPINGVYRLNYITLSTGTWIVTSQIQLTSSNNTAIDASISLSNTNGSMSNSNITSLSSTSPSLQNTLFYVTSTNTTIYCNLTYTSNGTVLLNTSGCFLKAMRIV